LIGKYINDIRAAIAGTLIEFLKNKFINKNNIAASHMIEDFVLFFL
jgi:hypothetical protein